MNLINTVIIGVAIFLMVFVEASFNGVRNLLGAQVDYLPVLMFYAGLSVSVGEMTTLALLGGLWFDSLSANPLGISILPLFLIGFATHWYRGLILREQVFAQFTLGLAASAVAPVLTLLLLLNTDRQPLLGWGTLWQWLVMTVGGGLMTPVWFWLLDRVTRALSYRPFTETSFRTDREIKRGR
jgi:cell shape-determining protein MreD